MIGPETISPAQGSAPSLPTNITGTPVNTSVVSQQNLGQRFNISQDPRFKVLFPQG